MTMDLRGSEILGYRLVELIAEGGMGSVWRAEHPDLDEVRVVKVLKPHLAEDAEVRKRFRIEARIQVKLGVHPHIVKVENFDRKGLAILMEYVEGKTLAELIQLEIGKIPHERALPWMLQILSALEYAHGQAEPVIHRDIKPSNIIVAASDDTARVMDFGIAKVAQAVQLTQIGSALGTSAYMAPEQFTGAGSIDQRADIYSLGVTFYEMLAGRPPFAVDGKGDSDFKFKLAHMNEVPRNPREHYGQIPVALADVVLRCLEKDPADRYQTVGELRQALGGGRGGAAETRIERGSAPVVPSAAGRTGRRPGMLVLLAVVLLVLLVGGVFAVRSKNDGGAKSAHQARAFPAPARSGVSRPAGAPDRRESPIPGQAPDSQAVASAEQKVDERTKEMPAPPPSAPEAGPSRQQPWVIIAKSVPIASGPGVARRLADRIRRAGFADVGVYDGRNFPNFRCCYWVVVVDALASRSAAAAAARKFRGAGFRAYVKNAFVGRFADSR